MAEEKKFELPPETRDGLDDLLEPYKVSVRDKLLDVLPIETRRNLEEENRLREEGGSPIPLSDLLRVKAAVS